MVISVTEGHRGSEPMTPPESTMRGVTGRQQPSMQSAEFLSTINRRSPTRSTPSTRGLLRFANRPPPSNVHTDLEDSLRTPVATAIGLDTTLSMKTPNTIRIRSLLAPAKLSVDRKPATIKLGAFTGTNMPLETHLAKLRNCAIYYGWTSSDCVCHLKASLEDAAATLLWELPENCTETELLSLLRSRFGTDEMVEKFRFELKQRRRKPNESIQSLYHDVCRLLALSYPGETGQLSQLVALDAFLDSIGDAEMRVRILERGAKTISEVYTIAARHEAYVASASTLQPGSASSSEDTNRRARAVGTVSEQSSISDRRISALCHVR